MECTVPSPAPVESRADQVVRLVRAAGARGLTSPELTQEARCTYGAASGALSRLHRQGRLDRTSTYREGCAAYIAAAAATHPTEKETTR